MGNSQTQYQLQSGQGYRIIYVEPKSYGSTLNLEIFLDFIIQIKSKEDALYENKVTLLESDEPIELTIFNIYTQQTRTIYVSEPRTTTKLGLQIRLETYIDPLILHITNVLSKSPAQESGLNQNSDYVLGMLSHRYTSIGEFSDLVTGMAYAKQAIELCIFSPTKLIAPHIITINPNFNWGGQGALGCEFASGILHTFTLSSGTKELAKSYDEYNEELIENNNENNNEDDDDNNTNLNNKQIEGEIILQMKEEIQEDEQNQQEIEQPQKQQIIYETPTVQGEEIIQFKGILRFKSEDSNEDDRQISTDQVELTKTKDIDLSLVNNSFQSKNASQDYSHLEQNKEQYSNDQHQTEEEKPLTTANNMKYVNNLVFQSSKRETLYIVDKRLLFDTEYQFPKIRVNYGI